jgi:hypothetical protein
VVGVLFDLQNYWLFVVFCAVIYLAISMYLQNNIGGKNRMRELQSQMRSIQLKLNEAAKSRNDKELDRLMGENMKLTWQLMGLQLKFAIAILIVFFAFSMVFSAVEPGRQDDISFQLYDDGLDQHCDASARDGVFSGCFEVPQNSPTGAQVVEVSLIGASNETLARSGTELFVEGGSPSDVWVQNVSQGGLVDFLLGKKSYHLNVTASSKNAMRGSKVAIHASAFPDVPQGAKFLASSNMGTFFYIDLPFTLPLLNIRRIIGSIGVLIFSAFVLSISYSLLKAVFGSLSKKF